MERIWAIYKNETMIGWADNADEALRKIKAMCRRHDVSDDKTEEIEEAKNKNPYNFGNSLYEVKMFENKIQYI